jgi:hypothetical protein
VRSLTSWKFTHARVYDIEETHEYLSRLGTTQVGQAVSGERGTTFTACNNINKVQVIVKGHPITCRKGPEKE